MTFPLSMPGVVAGTLLTFIPAAGDYINAELLGSPNDRMLGNVIQTLFTDANLYPIAGSLSMILMLLDRRHGDVLRPPRGDGGPGVSPLQRAGRWVADHLIMTIGILGAWSTCSCRSPSWWR